MGAWCPAAAAAESAGAIPVGPELPKPSLRRRKAADASGPQRLPRVRHSVPAHRRGAPKKGGILKREPAATQPLRGKRQWPLLCTRRARPVRPQVTFRPRVKVTEFARKLDGGGTVPFDGTLISLGLGRPKRATFAPLAKNRPYAEPIEDRAWVPLSQRVRLLRRAMRDARYFRARAHARREALSIQRSREHSNAHDEDRQLMPTSLSEARQRALSLASEVRSATAPRGAVAEAQTPAAVDRPRKRRRPLGSDGPESPLSKSRKLPQKLAPPPEYSSPASLARWCLSQKEDKDKSSLFTLPLPLSPLLQIE